MSDIPFTATRFEVEVVGPSESRRHLGHFTGESDAVAVATDEVGPAQWQVSLTAHSNTPETFALRHFRWTSGDVLDSGWRCWVDGVFVTRDAA